jgi:hypothetical protein
MQRATNVATLHISAPYGPDDGQGMTETCYPNEFI